MKIDVLLIDTKIVLWSFIFSTAIAIVRSELANCLSRWIRSVL